MLDIRVGFRNLLIIFVFRSRQVEFLFIVNIIQLIDLCVSEGQRRQGEPKQRQSENLGKSGAPRSSMRAILRRREAHTFKMRGRRNSKLQIEMLRL